MLSTKCLTLCNILGISDNEPRADLVRPCTTTEHSHQGKTARLEQPYLKTTVKIITTS